MGTSGVLGNGRTADLVVYNSAEHIARRGSRVD